MSEITVKEKLFKVSHNLGILGEFNYEQLRVFLTIARPEEKFVVEVLN